jgi:hypothetical protein
MFVVVPARRLLVALGFFCACNGSSHKDMSRTRKFADNGQVPEATRLFSSAGSNGSQDASMSSMSRAIDVSDHTVRSDHDRLADLDGDTGAGSLDASRAVDSGNAQASAVNNAAELHPHIACADAGECDAASAFTLPRVVCPTPPDGGNDDQDAGITHCEHDCESEDHCADCDRSTQADQTPTRRPQDNWGAELGYDAVPGWQ